MPAVQLQGHPPGLAGGATVSLASPLHVLPSLHYGWLQCSMPTVGRAAYPSGTWLCVSDVPADQPYIV